MKKIIDYTIPDSGTIFNYDEIDYSADVLNTINLNTTSIFKLNSSSCTMFPSESFSLTYVTLSLAANLTIPSNSILLFEVFGITNPEQSIGLFNI